MSSLFQENKMNSYKSELQIADTVFWRIMKYLSGKHPQEVEGLQKKWETERENYKKALDSLWEIIRLGNEVQLPFLIDEVSNLLDEIRKSQHWGFRLQKVEVGYNEAIDTSRTIKERVEAAQEAIFTAKRHQ